MSKKATFYVHRYLDDERSRRLPNANAVGVMLPDGQQVELAVDNHGDIYLRTEGKMSLEPQAANMVVVYSEIKHGAAGREIKGVDDPDGNREDAEQALRDLHEVSCKIGNAANTKTKGDREFMASAIRLCLDRIRKAL